MKTENITVGEKIKQILNSEGVMERDTWEKLVYLAYYMGRERATREISDKYAAHLAAQTARAESSRYHKMVSAILDNGPGFIYSGDYAGDFTTLFGSDKTSL